MTNHYFQDIHILNNENILIFLNLNIFVIKIAVLFLFLQKKIYLPTIGLYFPFLVLFSQRGVSKVTIQWQKYAYFSPIGENYAFSHLFSSPLNRFFPNMLFAGIFLVKQKNYTHEKNIAKNGQQVENVVNQIK